MGGGCTAVQPPPTPFHHITKELHPVTVTMPELEVLVPAAPPDCLRCMVWNLLNGGVDKGNEARMIDQLHLIAVCKPDVLCLPEATFWSAHEQRLLRLAVGTLGMRVVTLAKTRVGDGKNGTALLYNPQAVRLVNWRLRAVGVFHHALIEATFRPKGAPDDESQDFDVFATHLNPMNGEARLNEVSGWLTDRGGAFPGRPSRSVALADFNTPDREPLGGWAAVPQNLHRRYRLVNPDGSLGDTDQRAVRVLLHSGWQDPHDVLGLTRPPTVGHYYINERVPWAIDYALTVGMEPVQVWTHPFDEGFHLSDHLPHFVDVRLAA
jgi:endonuclease/exonuclease/phosphatase family metal-dependent hydrolase